MKNLILALAFGLPFISIAQQTEGQITYEETIKLEIDIPEEHRQMIGQLPTSQSNDKVLHFTAEKSMYKNIEKAEDSVHNAGSEDGDIQIKFVFATPESFYYKDLAAGQRIKQEEFFGRNFLITDQLEDFQWKLTNEQKVILNYPCTKAVHQDSSNTVVAWFTSQIPSSNGPDGYGQLPGMILEVDVNDGELTYVAKEVLLDKQDVALLEAPKKGKKVNQAEYEAIVEQKTKELEEEMGGDGMMIIRN